MNHHGIATTILATGRALAPDRFPEPTPDTINAWATTVALKDWPAHVWEQAVITWSTELATGRMVTPRDLIEAAHLNYQRANPQLAHNNPWLPQPEPDITDLPDIWEHQP